MSFRDTGARATLSLALAAATCFAIVAPAAADEGKAIYDSRCMVCHKSGVAGAPKLDDKANWAPRIEQGMEVMEQHAIKGFKGKVGMMPPKGGAMDLSDEKVKLAVKYMVEQAK